MKAGLLLVLFAAVSSFPASAADDCRLVAGWKADGSPRTYTANNLYEYMDGGAEGYLIFGFARLEHQACAKGADSLAIDVSEMNGPDAAWGLFATRRNPSQPPRPIGMGGEILANRASFAKGRYYVELTATPGEDYRATLRAFVATLEKRLTGRSTPPQALAWFPKGYSSVKLIPQSVLGLRPLRRGFVAEYSKGQAFVVAESSARSAGAVLAALRRRFSGAASVKLADEAFQLEDKYLGGMCVFRKGRYLAGYAHLGDSSRAVSLSKVLVTRLP